MPAVHRNATRRWRFRTTLRRRRLDLDRGFARFDLTLIARRVHSDDLILVAALGDSVDLETQLRSHKGFDLFQVDAVLQDVKTIMGLPLHTETPSSTIPLEI